MPEVKKSITKKGYVYIGIEVRITMDIQINHTDINAPLEKEYRKFEQEPMITQLWSDPNPKPTCDDMMQMPAEIFWATKLLMELKII